MNYTTLFKEWIITGQNCFQIQSYSTYFSKFSCGGMPLDPPRRSVLCTLVCVPKINIFHCHSFQWAPLKFFGLLRPALWDYTV